ncbi:MAG: SRPBCC family protein [Nannocystaceae bacterium]
MKFVYESVIPASVSEVFAFHESPDALRQLQPPWERTRVVQPPRSLEVGTVVVVETFVGPFRQRIVAEHTDYERDVRFVDEMREGPFVAWRHQHLFFSDEEGCRLRDEIDYTPPLGWLGRIAAPVAIDRRLRRMFDFRHRVTRDAVVGTSVG